MDGRNGSEQIVLVVDDEDPVRDLVSKILGGKGYTVIEAADAQEAMDIFARLGDLVSLVITDIRMPGKDGHALSEDLRNLKPDVPVIYMSAYFEGRPSPNSTLIFKPFNSGDLLEKVRRTLEGAGQA